MSDPLEVCPFPAHRGRPWDEVIEDDRPYVEWLIGGEGPPMDEALCDRLVEMLEEA